MIFFGVKKCSRHFRNALEIVDRETGDRDLAEFAHIFIGPGSSTVYIVGRTGCGLWGTQSPLPPDYSVRKQRKEPQQSQGGVAGAFQAPSGGQGISPEAQDTVRGLGHS